MAHLKRQSRFGGYKVPPRFIEFHHLDVCIKGERQLVLHGNQLLEQVSIQGKVFHPEAFSSLTPQTQASENDYKTIATSLKLAYPRRQVVLLWTKPAAVPQGFVVASTPCSNADERQLPALGWCRALWHAVAVVLARIKLRQPPSPKAMI